MPDRTKIEWSDATWNPIAGCTRVSEGCRHCYAERQAARGLPSFKGLAHFVGRPDGIKEARWTGAVTVREHLIDLPLRWKKPRKIFVNSLSDLFHDAVPDEVIDRIFAVMALCPQHTFQVLTKRPERMRDYLSTRAGDWVLRWPDAIPVAKWYVSKAEGMSRLGAHGPVAAALYDAKPIVYPLPNVWMGVSVEDQVTADVRIPYLLRTPSAIRFVSYEPALGVIDWRQWMHDYGCSCGWGGDTPMDYCRHCDWRGWADGDYGDAKCPECGELLEDYNACPECDGHDGDGLSFGPNSTPRLDLIIMGGESGPNARPMHPDWVRQTRNQCEAASVPFFFKQWGEWAPICEMTDAQSNALYHENADEGRDLVRRCKVDSVCLNADGTSQTMGKAHQRHDFEAGAFTGHRPMSMFKIGKRAAGRRLGGIEHNGMPAVRHA